MTVLVLRLSKTVEELFSGSKDKAEILRQFSSVFTADYPGSSVQLIGSSVPIIDNLSISAAGVQKLVSKINPSKATGPGDVPCRVLTPEGAVPQVSPSIISYLHNLLSVAG